MHLVEMLRLVRLMMIFRSDNKQLGLEMIRDTLTKIIEKHQSKDDDQVRDYIGASIIGSDCLRQIWYEFKGTKAESVPTKTRRTWAIGKKLERLIFGWLKDAGAQVQVHDYTHHAKDMPYFQGHFDGLITVRQKLSILEIKTAKDASFKIFVKSGVKLWNPQYFAQIQSYMGMSGIHSTYILVLNKDNSDLSDELVLFDEEYYQQLEQKALMISTAVIEPPRINGSPMYFKCKMCKFNKVCHI